MATITNTVTLDEIINTIKLRTGITDHYRLTSVVLSMLQEFNLFYIKEKKSIEINPNGRNFIELPTDFVEYQKIGYILPNGEIQTLTKNERLVDSVDIICGDNLSWIEQQGVDNCVDPYTVEANQLIDVSDYIYVQKEYGELLANNLLIFATKFINQKLNEEKLKYKMVRYHENKFLIFILNTNKQEKKYY